ncbi:MAG: hypothetical protein AAGN46_14755 [Acidobacteriota bacterium]
MIDRWSHRRAARLHTLLIAVLCLTSAHLSLACAGPDAAVNGEAAGSSTAPSAAPPEAAAPPDAGGAPDGGLAPATSRTPSGPSVSASGLLFDLPAAWQQQQPSSSMRAAQAAIPGANGAGELTVFYFGPGGGGSVEANLQRWAGQIESDAVPNRESFEVNGLRVTWLDASGTLKASTMGVGPTEPQPDSRLFAAVVEGGAGPWFFKATGPQATMAEAQDDFVALLQSVRAES